MPILRKLVLLSKISNSHPIWDDLLDLDTGIYPNRKDHKEIAHKFAENIKEHIQNIPLKYRKPSAPIYYRGLNISPAGEKRFHKTGQLSLKPTAFQSWTSDPQEAKNYGNVVVKKKLEPKHTILNVEKLAKDHSFPVTNPHELITHGNHPDLLTIFPHEIY